LQYRIYTDHERKRLSSNLSFEFLIFHLANLCYFFLLQLCDFQVRYIHGKIKLHSNLKYLRDEYRPTQRSENLDFKLKFVEVRLIL
jgi:hypothetical protein